MAANVWDNQLNVIERGVLSPFSNIRALFLALPFDGKDSEMSTKLRGALQDKSGFFLNDDFAKRLNEGLTDQAVRDKIVKLNNEDPATLNTILDAAIKNPEGLVDRIKNTPVPSEAPVSKFVAEPKKEEKAPDAKKEPDPKKEEAKQDAPAKEAPVAAKTAAKKSEPEKTAHNDDGACEDDKKKGKHARDRKRDDDYAPEALSGNPSIWGLDPKIVRLLVGLVKMAISFFAPSLLAPAKAPEQAHAEAEPEKKAPAATAPKPA